MLSDPLETVLPLVLTFAIGLVGALAAKKLKWPGPYIIGALVAVAVFNIITDRATMPDEVKVFTQIVTGLFIGSRITRDDVGTLKRVILPAALASLAMIFFCILMGLGLYLISDMSASTAMLSTAPGGLVDIVLMSYDLEADVPVVSALQVLRFVVVVSVFPALVIQAIRRFKLHGANEDGAPVDATPAGGKKPRSRREMALRMGLSSLVAAVCGITGRWLGVPAGALMFSMIGVTVFNVLTGKVYMPYPVKQFAQVLAGTLIGTSLTMTALTSLRGVIVPALIMVVGYFLINLLIATILHRRYGFDMITAFLCITPGGASDISLLAGDLGADTAKVSIIQVTRSTCVVIFYPLLVQYLTTVLA